MENFKITKEQVLQLVKNNKENKEQLIDADLRNWFPEAFEKELEIGKWYKSNCAIFQMTKIENELGYAHGIDEGIWKDECSFNLGLAKNDVEATEQEVKTALIAEAKKRGFGSKGVKFIDVFGESQTSGIDGFDFWNLNNSHVSLKNKFNISVDSCGCVIFRNGKWATVVVETITKEEAEKLLNKKII